MNNKVFIRNGHEILKKKHQEQLDNIFNQRDSNQEIESNFIEPQIPSDPLLIDGASLGKTIY